MKRFAWRLQRLLDIKIKQEDAIRNELMVVTEQALSMRGAILREKAALRNMLEDLRQVNKADRIGTQQLVLGYTQCTEQKIQSMELKHQELKKKRQETLARLLETRKFRKGLEKLREKAKEEYLIEQNRLEQSELDDRVNTQYARRIMVPESR